jgi:tetratricopeptide (TPR) repeat protein
MWPTGVELSWELRDLLEAQSEASEDFPYDLLQVKRPGLSQIYVRQFVRRREVDRKDSDPGDAEERDLNRKDSGRKDSSRREAGWKEVASGDGADEVMVEETMTVAAALDANEHLLITGDAGAGKSTIGHVFCKSIGDYWLNGGGPAPLREPVVPLRMPARALVAEEAWSTALARGAKEAMGRSLRTPPDPAMFAERALGARWLVFVDGLDEIADETTRRHVVRALARMARRGTDYRLVITTRRLNEALMEMLDEARIATVNLEPFGYQQLVEFADAWFRAQDPISAPDQSREFVRQTSDGQLRELVRNPLLATITAITFTKFPDRSLPSKRIDLYSGFMAALLDEQVSRRNIIVELRRVLAYRSSRLRLAEWIGEQRAELIRYLGRIRLESETPLLEAATAWVADQQPDLPDGWEQDLRAILAGSGVFVYEGEQLQFLHHSFAEFLAAQFYATTLSADTDDLHRWIERSRKRHASDLMILFTLVLWGRRPGNDLDAVVRGLLQGDIDRVELAGQLLAEGASITDILAAEVTERILNLIVAAGGRFGELLGAFDSRITKDLYELVDRDEVNIGARIECAIALGRLAGAEYGARKLEALVAIADDDSLPRAVRELADVVPDGLLRAEQALLAQLSSDPTPQMFPVLVEELLGVGSLAAAASAVRELVQHARTDMSTKVGRWTNPAYCVVLARLALRCKALDEVAWVARLAIASPRSDERTLADATTLLLAVSSSDSTESEVLNVVVNRTPSHCVRVAEAMATDQPHLAKAIAQKVLGDPTAPLSDLIAAMDLLLSLGHLTADELLTLPEREPRLVGEQLMDMATALAKSGALDNAIKVAWRVLSDTTSDEIDFASAAELLLENGAEPAQIRAIADSRTHRYQTATVQALCEAEHAAEAEVLTRSLIQHRIDDIDDVLELVPHLVSANRQEAAELLLTKVEHRVDRSSTYTMTRLARALLALNRRTDAASTAREAAEIDTSPRSGSDAIECWLDATGSSAAEELSTDTLTQLHPEMKATAAAALANRGLLTQATTLWLDLITNATATPELRFQAAHRLVAFGQRQRAIETLQNALNHNTHPDLRPTLGWVYLSKPTDTPTNLTGILRPTFPAKR